MNALASRLVTEMNGRQHWRGKLSSSALSTATAICALELYRRATEGRARRTRPIIEPLLLAHTVPAGAGWLCRTQNADGGWGDTVDSPSNISTTTLCWAALGLLASDPTRGGSRKLSEPASAGRKSSWREDKGADAPELTEVLEGAESWLCRAAGDLSGATLEAAIVRSYGDDRTFSAPILTMCALSGRLGDARRAWEHVPPLPFELAALPRRLFRLLGLPTVSYALPALIAIGQARHHHLPSRNPLARLARDLARRRTLRKLLAIQPPHGGFLEATPLTAFVTMGLVSIGEQDHEVTRRGVGFLLDSMRDDGGWPIDTDLATWVTTLAVGALARGGRVGQHLGEDDLQRLGRWLLGQQFRRVHPYTGARPGGWAWTDHPGGVPDADDTAGALLALRRLDEAGAVDRGEAVDAARRGIRWLLDLQNRDGGIPTFCRGWGKLPFDRSGADLTAHALRAWDVWGAAMPPPTRRRLQGATRRAVRFLIDAQRSDGAWMPLWFGNQLEPRQENPVYGTARVLLALGVDPGGALGGRWRQALERGRRWLWAAQNADGGWGGGPSVPSTVEETALAAAALAACDGGARRDVAEAEEGLTRAMTWLEERTAACRQLPAAPIGLYFAKLWYSERLYPLIFATAAAEAMANRVVAETTSNRTAADSTHDRAATTRPDIPQRELRR